MSLTYENIDEKYNPINFKNKDYENEIEKYLNLVSNISSDIIKQNSEFKTEQQSLKLEIHFTELESEININITNIDDNILDNEIKKLICEYFNQKCDFLEINLNAISSKLLKHNILLEKTNKNLVKCNITSLFGIFKNYRISNKFKKRKLTDN